MRNGAVGLVLTALALVVPSCSTEDDTVLVLAAASLSDAFQEIETQFESQNPTIDIQLSFAGSASLREQIVQGAPADVFASANELTMQTVIDAGAATVSVPFARNSLQLGAPIANTAQVTSIADLANPDLLIGLCAVGVPCGDFAREALRQAGVEAEIDTNESDVRALLTKLVADELDVGVVYRTDVLSTAEVVGIDLPAVVDVDISYPIAVLTEAPHPGGAQAFVDFVRSSAGGAILQDHGFGSP